VINTISADLETTIQTYLFFQRTRTAQMYGGPEPPGQIKVGALINISRAPLNTNEDHERMYCINVYGVTMLAYAALG
jgi:hypothetical protein